MITTISAWFMAQGWLQAVLAGISVYIFLSIVERVIKKRKAPSENIPDDDTLSETPIEFFAKRPDLQWLLGKVKDSRICWGAWFIGGTVSAAGLIEVGKFEKLVLLHPEHPALDIFQDIQPSFEGDRLSGLIRDVTKDAEKKGDVRWCPDILYSLLTIGNPPARETDPIPADAWALVEVYVPGIEAMDRPGFFVTYEDNPELCANMVKAYSALWGHCKPFDESLLGR